MDTVSNEPKPEDEMADGRTMDTDLDAAIRELDRFRRRETWTVEPTTNPTDATERAPVDAQAGEIAGPAPDMPSPPVAAPEHAHKDRTGPDAHGAWDADDNDDDLFDPEPMAPVAPEPAERSGTDQPVSAFDTPLAAEPARDQGAFDQPADERVAEGDADAPGTPMDTEPADFDTASKPSAEPAEEHRTRVLSDFDSGFEENVAETTPQDDVPAAADDGLPQAGNLRPLFAEATAPPAEEPPSFADDIVPVPAAEPVTLPRRMFGLKRALDARRIGVPIDDLPGRPEPEPVAEQTAVSSPESDTIATAGAGPEAEPAALAAPEPEPEAEPKVEHESWFGSRRVAASEETKAEGTSTAAAAAIGGAALAGAAAAAMPKADRKGWFGSHKTADAEIQPAESEPTPAAPAAPPVEPEPKPGPKAERKGWFGSRRKPEAVAAAAESKIEAPAIAPAAPPPKADDPFAAMTAAIGPKPKSERKGWFGSKQAPAPDAETAATSEMVDLAPVREALQAAALKRSDAPEIDGAAPAAAAAPFGEAPAASVANAGRVGVLLVNLGTPDSPKPRAVRRYLREFLSDRRVIEKDTFTWQVVFRGIILPFRPGIKARAYRTIWNREKNESPLKTITRAQAAKLGEALTSTGSDTAVDWAMRYGNPSLASRIKALIAQGCERILLVPLYPQYSSATTATACDEAFRVLTRLRNQPSLRVAPPYYADPTYIEAVASSIESELAGLSFEPEVILCSYHGMPLEYVQKGDPYLRHCTRTTELLRERLGMAQSSFVMTFQSRFGRTEWLQPYTDQTLRKLAKDGVKSVAVVTPGFAADCLETLEEIAVENAHIFKKRGGRNFAFIPCLNDSERGMLVIREIAARELRGWL